jgi:alpha-amylase
LPSEILSRRDNYFITPSEAIEKFQVKDKVSFPHFVSWADEDRDLSAWKSNYMQEDALEKLYALEKKVLASKNKEILENWRRLQTSDHFYYMCTKWFNDGDVHKYFNPYESPFEAFISFMNALNDLKLRLEKSEKKIDKVEKVSR